MLTKLIVRNNVSDTCNSDHYVLNEVCVSHALGSTTHFQQEGTELIYIYKVCWCDVTWMLVAIINMSG